MSFLKNVTIKSELANYIDLSTFENDIRVKIENIKFLIYDELLYENLINIEGIYTQDETHYKAIVSCNWKDEASYNSFITNSNVNTVQSILDSSFEVTRI